MKKYYAGIGSRETPDVIIKQMVNVAITLRTSNYILRSGGAIGADKAFESGAGSFKEIFKAKDATEEAIEYASKFHPAWDKCNDYARKLHGRNSMIILGKDLKTPVSVVYCFTKNGKDIGGTGLGIRIAKYNNIQVFNLYDLYMTLTEGKEHGTLQI